MIDHLTIRVSDYERSKSFYLAALEPLGFTLKMEFDYPGVGRFGGLGKDKPELWLAAASAEHIVPVGMHVALAAESHAQIAACHAAALAAGGKDDGAPGPRAEYHPDYYGAFVVDPDGVRLEFVKHTPE